MLRMMRSRAGKTGAAFSMMMAATVAAGAGEEVILRHEASFDRCPSMVSAMLESLKAEPANTVTTIDTGAHYGVKVIAASANLVFLCNAVTEQMTVTRTTPGELVIASE